MSAHYALNYLHFAVKIKAVKIKAKAYNIRERKIASSLQKQRKILGKSIFWLPLEMGKVITDQEEMLSMIESSDVRKTIGSDKVVRWVLIECAKTLTELVCTTVQISLDDEEVPDDWKRVNMVPFYKGSYKDDPLNLRQEV